MKLPLYKINGIESGEKVDLNGYYFDVEPNENAIFHAVVAEMASKRQGTHSSKNRARVRGGGRKPYRQKGTGRARQGTIRSPLLVGGGRIFGPLPHKYNYKISKSMKDLAKRSCLSDKARQNKIKIIEDFDFDEPKTKKMINIIKALDLDGQKILLLTENTSKNLLKSCRNIVKLNVQEFSKTSIYEVLKSNILLVQKSVIDSLNKVKS